MTGTTFLTEAMCIAGAALGALYVAAASFVAHRFTTPKRVAPSPPAPADDHHPARVQFTARGDQTRLVAWYHRTPDAIGAVILVHGRDACRGTELRGSSLPLVRQLMAQRLSVVLLDLRGHGESQSSRLTFGRKERLDILGAVDFLLLQGIQRGSIGVLGASMGGASAIAAAADDPAIGALITDSAFADLHDVLRRQFTRLTHLPTWMLGSALVVARLLTGVSLVRQSPAGDITRLRGRPTLVIHGERDPFVPVGHAHALAVAGGAQLWITPSDRHLGSFGCGVPEYVGMVSGFFARHLPSSAVTVHPAPRTRRAGAPAVLA